MIGSFGENGFEATLSSKTNFLSVWKEIVETIETVFLESEAKC